MAVTSLDNQRLLQVWQFSGIQEGTLSGVVETAKAHGFTGVLIKAIDGVTWMGHVEGAADALRSVDQARQQAAVCHDAGLLYCLWTNPLFDVDQARQAQLTGQLALACDALFLDVEPYDHFWGSPRPAGAADAFMTQVRAVAPQGQAYLVLQPDPRPTQFPSIRPNEWLFYCDALAGQHYFATFGSDPLEEMDLAVALGQGWGRPVYPTVNGDAPVAHLAGAVARLAERGITGWVAWRLGTMDGEQLSAVGKGMPDAPAVAVPQPRLTEPAPDLRPELDLMWSLLTESQRATRSKSMGSKLERVKQEGIVPIKQKLGYQ